MAFSLNLILVILSISIISVFQNPNSSLVVKADEALIQNLCTKTSQPGICKDCLHGNPDSPTADAVGLSRMSVACAFRSASRFTDDLYKMWDKSNDPTLTSVLWRCWNNTLILRDIINNTYSFIYRSEFYNARANMYGAIQTVNGCADFYHKMRPGKPVPDLIAVETDVVRQDCEVVVGLLSSIIG